VWSERASPLAGSVQRVARARDRFRIPAEIDLGDRQSQSLRSLGSSDWKVEINGFPPRMACPPRQTRCFCVLKASESEEMDWWDTTRRARERTSCSNPAQHFSSRGPFDSQTNALGELFDQGRRGRLIYFGERRRIFSSLQGNSRPLRTRRYRSLADRGLRAAMVHEGDSHESRRRPSRPMRTCGPGSRSAFISERFNSRRKRSMLRREIWWPLSLRQSGSKSFVTLSEGVTTIYSWAGDAWHRLARS